MYICIIYRVFVSGISMDKLGLIMVNPLKKNGVIISVPFGKLT